MRKSLLWSPCTRHEHWWEHLFCSQRCISCAWGSGCSPHTDPSGVQHLGDIGDVVMTRCPNESDVDYSLCSTSYCCSSVTTRILSQFLSQHPQFHWMAGKSQNISLLINFITTEHTYMYIHY